MTEAQAIETLWQTWKAGWAIKHPEIDSFFENEGAAAETTYARISVRHTTGAQTSIGPPGSRRFERRGNLMVQLFAPTDQGRGYISGLADDVRSIFEGGSFGSGDPVRCYGGRTQEVPTDGNWYMVVVVIPISYFERR